MPSDFPIPLVRPAVPIRIAFDIRKWLLVAICLPILALCVVFDLIYFVIVRMR